MLIHMEEIEKFKDFLGPAGKGYSQAQLHELRREMYAMADLLLDIFLQEAPKPRPEQGPLGL
jgi:hypothetical protein